MPRRWPSTPTLPRRLESSLLHKLLTPPACARLPLVQCPQPQPQLQLQHQAQHQPPPLQHPPAQRLLGIMQRQRQQLQAQVQHQHPVELQTQAVVLVLVVLHRPRRRAASHHAHAAHRRVPPWRKWLSQQRQQKQQEEHAVTCLLAPRCSAHTRQHHCGPPCRARAHPSAQRVAIRSPHRPCVAWGEPTAGCGQQPTLGMTLGMPTPRHSAFQLPHTQCRKSPLLSWPHHHVAAPPHLSVRLRAYHGSCRA